MLVTASTTTTATNRTQSNNVTQVDVYARAVLAKFAKLGIQITTTKSKNFSFSGEYGNEQKNKVYCIERVVQNIPHIIKSK